MAYDIAIFEGEPPSSHKAASETYLALIEQLKSQGSPARSPRILAFVDELAERWPGGTDEALQASPWVRWPLIDDAAGPMLHTGLKFSRADEVVPLIARIADSHGLNCFDPQSGTLIAPAFAEPESIVERLFGR